VFLFHIPIWSSENPHVPRSLPSIVEDILLRPLLVIQQLLPEFIRIFKSSLTVAADGCPISALPENCPDGTIVDPCDISHGLAIFSLGEVVEDVWFYLWRGFFEGGIRGVSGIEFETLKNDAKKEKKKREEEKKVRTYVDRRNQYI
jgi:hypothetical protein